MRAVTSWARKAPLTPPKKSRPLMVSPPILLTPAFFLPRRAENAPGQKSGPSGQLQPHQKGGGQGTRSCAVLVGGNSGQNPARFLCPMDKVLGAARVALAGAGPGRGPTHTLAPQKVMKTCHRHQHGSGQGRENEHRARSNRFLAPTGKNMGCWRGVFLPSMRTNPGEAKHLLQKSL